jgi:hypothetical protein
MAIIYPIGKGNLYIRRRISPGHKSEPPARLGFDMLRRLGYNASKNTLKGALMRKRRRRSSSTPVLALVGVVGLLVIIAVAWWTLRPPEGDPIPPTPPPGDATPPPTRAPVTPITGDIPHPTGARDIVVQLNEGYGYEPDLYIRMAEYPDFTLYGDGTAIYRNPSGYHQARLDPAAVQGLLRLALNDLRFLELPADNGLPGDLNVTDLPTATIRVAAAGQDYTVGAYALGIDLAQLTQAAITPEPADAPRSRLLRLEQAIRALMADTAPAYAPAAVTLYIEDSGSDITAPDQPTPTPDPAFVAWPVSGVVLAGDATDQFGTRMQHLTGPAAAAALQAAAAPRDFTEAGRRYQVVAVPDAP